MKKGEIDSARVLAWKIAELLKKGGHKLLVLDGNWQSADVRVCSKRGAGFNISISREVWKK